MRQSSGNITETPYQTITIRGADLHYASAGSGDPVVLVHGSAGDLRTWAGAEKALASHFRTIRYSRRFHWPNTTIPDGAEYAMDEHVLDLASLIESFDAAPAHIVGHSYGGFVSLLLAVRRPELVRCLVLLEPPILPLLVSIPPRPAELLRLLIRDPATAAGIVRFGASGIGPATKAGEKGDLDAVLELTGRAILGPASFESLSPERLQQARDNTMKEELLSERFFSSLSESMLRGVDKPTLLVTGERSPRLWPRLVGYLDRLMPNTTRVEVSGASHMMHEDNAAEFTEAVRRFLQEQ
ncbi:MAG: alpha/beta hydrolase [Bacteroidetes bacterium]|nr:alpha/beta hydrolase [Bacteroidota bacterium]